MKYLSVRVYTQANGLKPKWCCICMKVRIYSNACIWNIVCMFASSALALLRNTVYCGHVSNCVDSFFLSNISCCKYHRKNRISRTFPTYVCVCVWKYCLSHAKRKYLKFPAHSATHFGWLNKWRTGIFIFKLAKTITFA